MNADAAESIARTAVGMTAAPLETGGGAAGAEKPKDGSEGSAVHSRSADGPQPDSPTPPETPRLLEKALRGLGYSKAQARAIVHHGFKGLATEPDPAEDSSDDLERLAAALRGAIT